jgi:hypothetical protein
VVAVGIAAADIAAAGTVAESSRSQEHYLQIGLGGGHPSDKISELIPTLIVRHCASFNLCNWVVFHSGKGVVEQQHEELRGHSAINKRCRRQLYKSVSGGHSPPEVSYVICWKNKCTPCFSLQGTLTNDI